MTSALLLRMEGIVKRFPGVLALDGVTIDLRPGEVHVLCGENGAGKSTLVKILSGAYQADSGKVFINGTRAIITNPHQAQLLGISTIYQEFCLVPQLTVAENIFLGREPLKGAFRFLDRKTMYARVGEILKNFDLPIDPEAKVKSLSVAEKQLVEIAKALAIDAKILIMDEPTAALNIGEINQLFRLIGRFKTKGTGVIYISHRLDEIGAVGDRVTVLRDGRLIGTLEVGCVKPQELIKLMIGQEIKEKFPKAVAPIGVEILKIANLTRRGFFRRISFSLRAGEVLAIAGLVGAGRTELIRSIFGLDPYDEGRIEVMGKPLKISSPAVAIGHGVGFLPSERHREGLVICLSVKENISLASLGSFSHHGFLKLRREEKTAQSYVERLDIKTPGIGRMVKFLSGGNQQKVILAKALCCQSKIFLFDEPTRGIDVGSKVEIYRLINELTQQGAGIIMISSELPEILGMSDRILVMRKGEVTGEFLRQEATQEKILSCAFGQ